MPCLDIIRPCFLILLEFHKCEKLERKERNKGLLLYSNLLIQTFQKSIGSGNQLSHLYHIAGNIDGK